MRKIKITKDKVFYWFENRSIIYLISLLFAFFFINHYLYVFDIKLHSEKAEMFLQNDVRSAVENMESSLLTIAAIFIGIYVTVFTLLGSIKVDSVFAFLNEKTFKRLIIFIRNAFIASFVYLLLIMGLEVVYSDDEIIPLRYILLNMLIVIYMFLTALRLGIILYISFDKDLDDLHSNIRKHRQKRREVKELQLRVEKFLDDFEREKQQEKNNHISEVIRNREEEKQQKKDDEKSFE
ncbi:hypothetical protein [Alkalibacillus almallahensis]|uniref:hypothetical protein n=1 Tax=Alkalibacillus almallahensis TaxID=1379154 RepID=UPI00142367C5|nr:hypothetical protein [Alkalibacillus almallahensis]NIK11515.1 hypothetical protein [Alkalibacillus almallahensis]